MLLSLCQHILLSAGLHGTNLSMAVAHGVHTGSTLAKQKEWIFNVFKQAHVTNVVQSHVKV